VNKNKKNALSKGPETRGPGKAINSQLTAYVVSYRVYEQITGGEKLNWAILEVIQRMGVKIVAWEGKEIGSNTVFSNIKYWAKCLTVSKPCFFILDIDYCARFLLALFWIKKILRIPIVGTVFHFKFSFQHSLPLKIMHQFIESIAARSFDVLITISQFSLEKFESLTKKRIKTYVIPPFIKSSADESPVVPNHGCRETFRMISIGAIDYRKNFHTLLESLLYLKFPYHLDIIGHIQSVGYYNTLLKRIHNTEIQGKCTFFGFLEKEKVEDLLRKSDIFVLVSEMEGYGMVYAEAMKFGLPIIASNRGAIPELVVHNENGFLCPPHDSKEIANALTRLVEPDVWKRISTANIEKYKTLMDKNTFAQKCEKIFSEILDEIV
jgi:glycosyltransferase involved in cell wall biosynthesis